MFIIGNKKAMAFSITTIVVIIFSLVILGSGIILIKNIAQASALPAFNQNTPIFFRVYPFPDKGQLGTVFQINLELTNNTGIYRIDAKIMEFGRIVKTIPLYDDGAHGDNRSGDGIYANIWDSSGEKAGIYDVGVVINPSENKQLEYSNITSVKIYHRELLSM